MSQAEAELNARKVMFLRNKNFDSWNASQIEFMNLWDDLVDPNGRIEDPNKRTNDPTGGSVSHGATYQST